MRWHKVSASSPRSCGRLIVIALITRSTEDLLHDGAAVHDNDHRSWSKTSDRDVVVRDTHTQ